MQNILGARTVFICVRWNLWALESLLRRQVARRVSVEPQDPSPASSSNTLAQGYISRRLLAFHRLQGSFQLRLTLKGSKLAFSSP